MLLSLMRKAVQDKAFIRRESLRDTSAAICHTQQKHRALHIQLIAIVSIHKNQLLKGRKLNIVTLTD